MTVENQPTATAVTPAAPVASVPPAPRRRFKDSGPGSAERKARKQAVDSICVTDDVYHSSMAMMEELLNRCEDGVEPVAIVFPAPPGTGKTHILKHCAANPRLAPFSDAAGIIRPLVRISAPAPCTLKTLGISLYTAMTGKTLSTKLQKHDIWTRVRTNLFHMGVSVVMVDELQHVFDNATLPERHDIISTLKALLIGEETAETIELLGKLPETVRPYSVGLVLSGMPELRQVIALDLQLLRRCRFKALNPLKLTGKDEGKFKKFLEIYATKLGFPDKPDLAGPDMLLRLHKASSGYRGRAAFLIKEAAFMAIDRGARTLDRKAHFAELFERIYETGDEKNPFLVADVKKIGKVKELERYDHSLLRGRKKGDGEDGDIED